MRPARGWGWLGAVAAATAFCASAGAEGGHEIAFVLAPGAGQPVGGEPPAVAALRALDPRLRYLGVDAVGVHRVLVPETTSSGLALLQERARRLGALAVKALPPREEREGLRREHLLKRAGRAEAIGLMVSFRAPALKEKAARGERLEAAAIERIERAIGRPIPAHRPMSGSAWALRFDRPMDVATGELLVQRLRMDPTVERVSLDTLDSLALMPSDPGVSLQWNLFHPLSGIRADGAWDITTGNSSIAVAVVDSGYLPHSEFADRVLPGADLISSAATSNDGDGRDDNPYDSGTFGPADICPPGLRESTWHGTFVAGIIAAAGNNGVGIAGINWLSRIVPVRTNGRCGSGARSDILDGLRWAVGMPVPGVANNRNPARVVNMSLAGPGECSASDEYQSAIVDALLRHATVVVAAGNESDNALAYVPASCIGAITVSATNVNGDLAAYSNFSAAIEIAAPGGDQSRGLPGVWSTSATGTGADPGNATFSEEQGTSFAAPHVAGVVSLMLSVNPNLTVAQVRDLVMSTSTPFPAGTACARQGVCGLGIVNAREAVRAARDTGQRYNLSALYWEPSESGWGLNLQQQGDILFGTWFTYGADGSPLWLVMPGLARVAEDLFAGDVYAATGVPFNQISGREALLSATRLGTAAVGFLNFGVAIFQYDLGAVTGAKAIEVQRFGAVPSCAFGTGSRAGLANYQDLWWNPTENGWGINLTHQGDILFATWFTYGANGAPQWFVGPEIRRTGPATFSGPLYATTGVPMNQINGSQALRTATAVGTLSLAFQDGERGQMSYTANGVSGTKSIVRQVFSSPLSVCR